MLFDAEEDTGNRIRFYLAPDAFSAVPEVRVVVDGVDFMEMAANVVIPAFIPAGRHETGVCGFLIDESHVPNLAQISSIEFFEKDTGVLIYRRPPLDDRSLKLLRLETRLLPIFHLDLAIMPHFHYAMQRVDRFGVETVTQMLLLRNFKSSYLSGRINYKNYQYFIEDAYECAIFVYDPIVLLAERLMTLSLFHSKGLMHLLGDRDAMLYDPAARFAAELQVSDGKSLRRALRAAPQEVRVALTNPLSRMLTTRLPDEMPSRGAVASSLNILSSFKIVDSYQHGEHFRDAMAAVVEQPSDSIPLPSTPRMVTQLAELLRAEGRVDHLIDVDLEIYEHIRIATEATTVIAEPG